MEAREQTLTRELRRLVHETNNFLCLCTVQAEAALQLGDERGARRALELILERSGGEGGIGLLPLDGLGLTPRERRENKDGPAGLGKALAGLAATCRLLVVTRSDGEASRLVECAKRLLRFSLQ